MASECNETRMIMSWVGCSSQKNSLRYLLDNTTSTTTMRLVDYDFVKRLSARNR